MNKITKALSCGLVGLVGSLPGCGNTTIIQAPTESKKATTISVKRPGYTLEFDVNDGTVNLKGIDGEIIVWKENHSGYILSWDNKVFDYTERAGRVSISYRGFKSGTDAINNEHVRTVDGIFHKGVGRIVPK